MASKRTYRRIARVYDILDLPFEHGRYRGIRPRLFEGVRGAVLDAGVGTGRNIPFYPPGAEVVGIRFPGEEPRIGSASLRARLE